MTAARRRSRASAMKAGTSFERALADYLSAHIDDRIDRRVKTGAKDRGDIAALRAPHGGRIVVEAKNTAKATLGPHHDEADEERRNDDALVALLAHKRHGVAAIGRQWITCTVDDLIALIVGERPATQMSSPIPERATP